MQVPANTFNNIANNLVTNVFAAFAKPLVISSAGSVDYGVDQVYLTETGTAIEIAIESKDFDNQLIEIGDVKIVTNADQWTTKPHVDSSSLNFNGSEYNIILVEEDADDAAFFITCRKK